MKLVNYVQIETLLKKKNYLKGRDWVDNQDSKWDSKCGTIFELALDSKMCLNIVNHYTTYIR